MNVTCQKVGKHDVTMISEFQEEKQENVWNRRKW